MKSGWTIKKLGEVCEEVKDRISSAEVVLSAYITTDNMLKDCAGVCEAENLPPRVTSLVKYRKGDILLSNIRPYLKKVWLSDRDGAASSDVIVFRVCSKEIYLRYFWRALARDEFFDYSMLNVSGTKMPRGKKEWIKQFEIPVPPLAEQKRIVAKIDAAFEKINKLKANAERNLANAKELFQSALEEAMRPKKGWVEKRLGEVGKATTGITPSTRNKENFGEYVPFVKPGDITPFEPIAFRKEGLSQKGVEESRLIIRGSTLMVCIGASIGKTGYANKDCTCNQQINALTPGDMVDGRFLYYLLSSEKFKSKVIAEAGQATLPIISKSKWECLAISLPTVIAEQRQIVKRLDILAGKTNLLKQHYTQQIADCAEMRQSVLREAFEGRL